MALNDAGKLILGAAGLATAVGTGGTTWPAIAGMLGESILSGAGGAIAGGLNPYGPGYSSGPVQLRTQDMAGQQAIAMASREQAFRGSENERQRSFELQLARDALEAESQARRDEVHLQMMQMALQNQQFQKTFELDKALADAQLRPGELDILSRIYEAFVGRGSSDQPLPVPQTTVNPIRGILGLIDRLAQYWSPMPYGDPDDEGRF